MSANVDAMVREGINAYKAGRKEEAHALLLKATELDQYNEQAWLWLSGLMESPDDQRTCLENVLAINPDNERAKQGLSYLTGQTSAGNTSPFSAGMPPSAPSPSVPTSVEWTAPNEPTSSASPWPKPVSPDPSPAVLDDWVTNLNLTAGESQDGVFTTTDDPSSASSPFGDFDMDEDIFAEGPFSASPLKLDDKPAAPTSNRRSPSASAPRTSPPPQPTRRSQPVAPRENGSLLYDIEAEQSRSAVPEEPGMFGYIPAEIQPTRLPGTRENTPALLRVGMIILILVNLGLAFVVMHNILT